MFQNCSELEQTKAVVPIVYSMDSKGSVTNSQGIHGNISVMATVKFTYFLN